MPYLIVDGAAKFIEYVKDVFDAELTYSSKRGELVGHCEAQIGGSTIMFSNCRDDWPPVTANMFVYVDDADETFRLATTNGGSTVMEIADQDYGRSGGVRDPFGNVWWITSVAAK
jgi:uncharacterized glyoxalase superfamily protein PhnB